MAAMVLETSDDHKNAKSALRDALRAKLKTGYSFEESIGSVSSNSSYEDTSSKLIDVETLGNESDDSRESDEKDNDEREMTSSSASNIPIEERRLRNRLAARKCREKRKNRISNLEKICNNLENRISMLNSEIEGLDGQKRNLTRILENHACVRLTPKPTAVITNSVLLK